MRAADWGMAASRACWEVDTLSFCQTCILAVKHSAGKGLQKKAKKDFALQHERSCRSRLTLGQVLSTGPKM